MKIVKVYSRPKFAEDFRSGLRSGRGCSEVCVFFGGKHSNIPIKKNQTKKRTSPQPGHRIYVHTRILHSKVDLDEPSSSLDSQCGARCQPGRIAMQPDKNPIRGLLGNYVISGRPNLRRDLGSGAASRCVPSEYSGRIADAGFDGSSIFLNSL